MPGSPIKREKHIAKEFKLVKLRLQLRFQEAIGSSENSMKEDVTLNSILTYETFSVSPPDPMIGISFHERMEEYVRTQVPLISFMLVKALQDVSETLVTNEGDKGNGNLSIHRFLADCYKKEDNDWNRES
ncbi:hypothetical protein NPIL_406501 [Nephila pilipes]|uniref:Uncharacterized protein n=1 Tax=Nephila pilipes TaxID=299642 RepID=A0A8X6MV56_NEPPI|nr:hypothetical protein NPIL_406501 [Nephila pilipes]